ncbi:MAG: glycosyltransferase [Bacteroidetes bacterium]|nr:glycosyltransferase [Bacteroidota bacterium]
MNILQVNASYKPAYIYGGPTMSVSKLSEQLAKAGCTVEVFTTTANGPAELPVEPGKATEVDGVKVTYFRRLTKDHSHFSPALLRRLWSEIKNYDVVHIHAWWNLVSVLSCQVAIMRGKPVVISPRGTLSAYSFTNRNSFGKKLMHVFLGKPLLKRSFMHVTSHRERQAMEKLVTAQRIFEIPNFVALPADMPVAQSGHHQSLRLLFFSRIDEKKGLEILFDALKNIGIPYRLTIAGNGEPAYVVRLKALAKETGIDQFIDWVGFRGEDKFKVLADHDLMVLPSYDENFGNVVIESLAVGTAVLVSDNVGLAGYVLDNKLGWVSSHDAGSFADAIISIHENPAELQRIRKHAPAKIRNDFNEEYLAKRYIGMYEQIISDGRI